MAEDDAKPELGELREKIRAMTDVELRALSIVLRRRTADYIEEIKVVEDQLADNEAKRKTKRTRRNSPG